MRPVELAAGVLLLSVGVRSAFVSVRGIDPGAAGRGRVLLALHEAAKAGFWLSLGGFFLTFALAEEPQRLRWFVLAPIAMAGLRLVSAALLGRG